MKTPSLLPPLFAALLAGCAHAPRTAPPVVAAAPEAPDLHMAEAIRSLDAFACMPPALYATALIEGDALEEEKRRERLESYAHAFMNEKLLDEYKKCLDEHPALPDGAKQRAEEAAWRAATQPDYERLAALYPDGEKIADAKDEYADADAAHTRLRILITRRDGKSVVLERTFEKQPDAKP